VDLTKFFLTVNVAALQDTIQLMESVVNALGIKFMMKVSEFAESHVMRKEYLIYPLKVVFVFLNTSHWLMVLVELALFIQPIVQSLKLVFVIQAIS
jgi:hypothetical protein